MKTLFRLFFILQISFCYGQTKQETIKWITDALDLHFKKIRDADWNSYANKLGDDCGVSCVFNFDKEYKEKYQLNLEFIDECEMKISKGRYLMKIPVQGTTVSKSLENPEDYSFFQNDKNIKEEFVVDGKRDVDYSYDTGTLIRVKIDAQLPEKISKAIIHLSRFCVVNKDLF